MILAGGSGSRLWPLSRRSRPKQFLSFGDHHTLLEATLQRCVPFGAPLLVGADEQRFLLTAALRSLDLPVRVVGEPSGRNTAAAATVAALLVARERPGSLLLLCPADHRVEDPTAFEEAVQRGAPVAAAGGLVVFGIDATSAHTGYGWIEAAGEGEVVPVRRFVEKPDAARAERFLAAGMTWNAGIFLVRPDVLLGEMERFEPAVLAACRGALARADDDGEHVRLDRSAWETAPSLPLDKAVVERTDRAHVVPVRMGWTDLGSLDALHACSTQDAHGNACRGDTASIDCRGSYLHGEEVLVTGIGLEDLVVVGTPDAVFVAPRDRAQDVRALVEQLADRPEVRGHPRGERPWGRYRVLDRGPTHQVKRLVVRPGGVLSLQRHAHRLEHWVVASGRGRLVLDDQERLLEPGDSVRIDVGVVHRLAAEGDETLVVVEVQIGSYLDEDDIERLEDVYGRRDGD